jgi:molybdopterin-guanine dinucleotide biosynthesis protein A
MDPTSGRAAGPRAPGRRLDALRCEDGAVPRARAQAPLLGGLLVGGESRRFGSPKALATLAGRSFAERVADALGAAVGEIVLLGSGAVPPALAALPRVADAADARGPIAGILGGLRARPGRALLVAACDQPLLTAEALAWLLARRAAALAVLGTRDGARVEPLPGIYEPAARPLLEELACAGGSLQPLGGAAGVALARIPSELARAWTSVDDPARRAALEAELAPSTIAPRTPPAGER